MFNAPRRAQRYGTSSSFVNGFGSTSITADDPLASSTYDGLDPWSSAPSPDLPTPSPAGPPSPLASVIADATTPPLYRKAFSAVDPSGSGETSVNSLSRVLLTSGLSASTIDRIVNLVSSRPRVSKLEFFIALALVALAQSGKDLSIEQVASLAAQNVLPIPSLDLDAIAPGMSTITSPPSYHTESPAAPAQVRNQPSYSSDDPWQATRFPEANGGGVSEVNGAPSSVSGTGMPKDWWRRQEHVEIRLSGMQGFILNRYMVYQVSSERGTPVSRRYSEFGFLWDCLVRRYPFRLLPQLPPKRVGPNESFLEQRRRGLQRFLNFVVNHPVIKEDGLLAVFLTEPSLEQWRKHTKVSLDEESASKRVDRVEEMTIPSDLEEKLTIVRNKLGPIIEQWQKICILAERIIKRREAAAVRSTHALFKRTFLSSVLTPFPTSASPPSVASVASPSSSLPGPSTSLTSPVLPILPSVSVFGSFASAPLVGSARPDGMADGGFYTSFWENSQADLSRLTMTLNALNEVNAQCWHGDSCELCLGVRSGLEQVSNHLAKQSDDLDLRSRVMSSTTLDALKSQRDLHIATRDLFLRHDRLSGDSVERLKKRIEATQMKLEGVRVAQKGGWAQEVDRLTGLVERDQASIVALLNRRVFIRYSMWHELRVVLHNRENALITQAVRDFAREERAFAEVVAGNWNSLFNAVENMPYE